MTTSSWYPVESGHATHESKLMKYVKLLPVLLVLVTNYQDICIMVVHFQLAITMVLKYTMSYFRG